MFTHIVTSFTSLCNFSSAMKSWSHFSLVASSILHQSHHFIVLISIRGMNLCKCIGWVPCGLHQFCIYSGCAYHRLLSVWEPWQNVLDGLQGAPSITGWWRWIYPLPVCSIFVSCVALPCTEAVRMVVEAAKPGVSVLSLCEKGDVFIAAETSKVFKREKDIKKGTRMNYGQVCYFSDGLVYCMNSGVWGL